MVAEKTFVPFSVSGVCGPRQAARRTVCQQQRWGALRRRVGRSQHWAQGRDGDGGRSRGRQAKLGLASWERGRRPGKRGRPRQKGGRGTGMSAKKARSRGGDRAFPSDSSRSRATARISWRAAVLRRPRISRRAATCFRLEGGEGAGAWGFCAPDTRPAHLWTPPGQHPSQKPP